MKTENGVITGTIDIRFPVTMKSKDIIDALTKGFESELGELVVYGGAEPLFYPKDSDLVRSLVKAYRDVTGDMESNH